MINEINHEMPPEEWTVEGAAAQLAYFQDYRQARRRPFDMQDIVDEATIATMEVLERLRAGSKAKRRKGELGRVAGDLAVRWHRYVRVPRAMRSDDHKIALVQAAWAIKVLRDALEAWVV